MKGLRYVGHLPLSRWVVAILALAAGFALGTAESVLATGTIPSADGVLHACFDNTNGVVRLIDPSASSCRTNESATSWSQTGQQGPAGPQGPTGTPGPSNAWFAHSPLASSLNGTDRVVLSIQVPAGNYVITARVDVANEDSFTRIASCDLSTGDSVTVRLAPPDQAGDEQVITLLDSATFASVTSITVSCSTVNGSALSSALSAIQIGTLH